jgi:hypothetical protein
MLPEATRRKCTNTLKMIRSFVVDPASFQPSWSILLQVKRRRGCPAQRAEGSISTSVPSADCGFLRPMKKKMGRSLPSDGRHSRRGGLGARWGHQKRPAEPGQQEPTMTALITRTIRQAAFVVAFAASVSALSSTSSFAYSAEAQQMCTGDAFRLCSSEIPNIPAITACMKKNRANLSTGCRAVMDKEAAAEAGKIAAK